MTALQWLLCIGIGLPGGVLIGWGCTKLGDYLAARPYRRQQKRLARIRADRRRLAP